MSSLAHPNHVCHKKVVLNGSFIYTYSCYRSMDLSILELSPAEEKVFAHLLTKQATATQLSKVTKVSPSNVYVALEKLIQRGLISKVTINSRPLYKYNGVEALERVSDELKSNYVKQNATLTQLKKQITAVEESTNLTREAEVFIGKLNLRSAYKRLFEQKGKEFVFFYKYDEITGPIVHDFFAKMDVNNFYKTISTRALFSKNYEQLHKQRKRAKFDVKFTDLPIPSSINIYGDKVLIISWSDEPTAFLLTSTEIANNYRDLFDDVWKRT